MIHGGGTVRCTESVRFGTRPGRERSGRRRVVTLFGPRGRIRDRYAHNDAPPRAVALGIPGGVPEGVLARQLVGDLAVDACQLRDLPREEDAAAGLLRQLTQHELRIAEPASPLVARAQADGVDRRLGPLGEIEHLVEANEAGRVLAVGEHDDRLSPDLVGAVRLRALQLFERDVDGVVQRGGSAGVRAANGGLEVRDVIREALDHLNAAVEVDDLREVLRAEPPDEADRGFLRGVEFALHAGARVQQDRERDRQVGTVEERDLLLRTVFEHLEFALVHVGEIAAGLVRDRNVDRHELDPCAERGPLRRRNRFGRCSLPRRGRRRLWRRRRLLCAAAPRLRCLLSAQGHGARLREPRREEQRSRRGQRSSHRHFPAAAAFRTGAGVPRTVRPGCLTLTSVFLGGISEPGRAYTTWYWFSRSVATLSSSPLTLMLESSCV